MHDVTVVGRQITRRLVLGAAAATVATPALSQQCQIGPSKHEKGPLVFGAYDQVELDAAYKQEVYEPLMQRVKTGLLWRPRRIDSRFKLLMECGVPVSDSRQPDNVASCRYQDRHRNRA